MTPRVTALILIVGSILTSLAVMEIGLRVAGYDAAPVVAPDNTRGWALIPNLQGITNSQGLRDRERTVVKPAGTVRIAVLGDSMAEGMQVTLPETFPSVLETLLNDSACFGAPVEVINFAVQGYGTAQQYLTLNQQVWAYGPDLLVLAFFPGNDVRDNSRALKGSAYLPFYDLSGGHLKLDLSFREKSSYRLRKLGATLIRHSRLAQGLNRVRFHLKAKYRDWADRRQTRARGLGEAGIDNMVFLNAPSPEWETAWNVTEALITQMNATADQHGVPFHLAILSTAIEADPDPQPRAALAAAIGVNDFSYPHRRLAKLGESVGFPVLDLTAPLHNEATRRQTCLHGEPGAPPCTGHYNPAGHRAAAEMLAKHLCPIAQ